MLKNPITKAFWDIEDPIVQKKMTYLMFVHRPDCILSEAVEKIENSAIAGEDESLYQPCLRHPATRRSQVPDDCKLIGTKVGAQLVQ